MIRQIAALFLFLNISAVIAFCSGCSPGIGKSIEIFDSHGKEIANFNTLSDDYSSLADEENRAYLETVLSEAESIISELNNISRKKARDYLLKNKCSVYTVFDETVYNAVKKSYQDLNFEELSFGCALTDLHGNLIATYSSKTNDENYINYAAAQTSPYSSFKPLCVYTPAIENSLANWSAVYSDSPTKKIKSEDGGSYDWPVNANAAYSNKDETLAYAIKVSLNTVAVRCMQTVGVENSLNFLEDKFDLVLEFEKKKSKVYGADEVIGNIALGHLFNGVSPIDMAGYYQAFANGGKYIKPHTILKICNKSGDLIYECKSEEKQIIKPSTAYIMNKLLQNVITPGGTGINAACDGVPVGGKTGTGDLGNWFIGFTPQYTCAVWHGTQLVKNNACDIFSSIIACLDNTEKINYPNCSGIKKAVYCKESGMLFSEKCQKADVGYYVTNNLPQMCNKH